MKLPRRNFLHLATVATVLPAIWRFAWAQNYPARPISISSPPTQLRFGARDLTFFWAPYSCTPLSNACCTGSAVTIGAACGRGRGRGRERGRAGSFCAVFGSSRFSASMQLLTAVGSKLCALHQASVGSAGCEPAGRLDCPSNAATAKMALLENRTGSLRQAGQSAR
jgi:hypothetical protein